MAKKLKRPIVTDCEHCGDEINHKILALEPADFEVNKKIRDLDYMIIECEGCNDISFLLREYNGRKGEAKAFYDLRYPNENEFPFIEERTQKLFPTKIRELYEEVENAFLSESKNSTALCLRTIVESICTDRAIKGNNLLQKLQGLQKQGLISIIELETMDKLRIFGNNAAHRNSTPEIKKLVYGLVVVNHVLTSQYILPIINKHLTLKDQTKKI